LVTETIEDYLKAILKIETHKGYAQVKDVAEHLKVKPPSVTEMFRRLDQFGLINYERYGGATLTAKGRHIASLVREKHRMIKRLFVMLGVDEDTADIDACKVEHALSDETVSRLSKFVDFVHESEERANWLEEFDRYCEACGMGDEDISSKE
jgi:DtxR family Mn-dependent transcriptional regulator